MWYSANLLFNSLAGTDALKADGVWEERVILIEASSELEAQALAQQMGRQGEVTYKNVYDETVSWRFDSIERLCEIGVEHPSHGSEIFSRFLKDEEVESLKRGFPDDEGQAGS